MIALAIFSLLFCLTGYATELKLETIPGLFFQIESKIGIKLPPSRTNKTTGKIEPGTVIPEDAITESGTECAFKNRAPRSRTLGAKTAFIGMEDEEHPRQKGDNALYMSFVALGDDSLQVDCRLPKKSLKVKQELQKVLDKYFTVSELSPEAAMGKFLRAVQAPQPNALKGRPVEGTPAGSTIEVRPENAVSPAR